MITLIIGLVVAALLFYQFVVKHYDYWPNKGVKQGKPVWILGDNWGPTLRKMSFAGMVLYTYNQVKNTRYSGMYQFFIPTLVLKDPDLIKQITVKDFDHFSDHRSFIPENADPLWGKNLFALKGQRWRDMRAILSPSFTSSKMKQMFVLMSECSENFVQFFSKKDQDVVVVELKDAFTRYTNDVIGTTAFGIKTDSLKDQDNEFYLMGKEATDFAGFWKNMKFFGYFLVPKLFEILGVKLFSNEVTIFFQNLINDTIKAREEQGIIRPDMIHLLMEARKGYQKQEENCLIDTGFATVKELVKTDSTIIPKEITNLDIAAQAMIFFFAGFDTVSSLMCFMSYELAVNQDIQNRLREEVEETNNQCGGKLTYEALLKMKYMDMVVSEALRKWPVAVAVDRVCTKPYTIPAITPEEKPVHLEIGTVLWLPIFALHRNPEHYPDPEKFDPERFNDENKNKIKPYTYFPFGLGPRNCIGSRFALLETKAVFYHILLNFVLEPTKDTQIPLKISKKSFNLTAEKGFPFGLRRIKK